MSCRYRRKTEAIVGPTKTAILNSVAQEEVISFLIVQLIERKLSFFWHNVIIQKFAVSIPDGVDSASNRNECQECFVGVQVAGA